MQRRLGVAFPAQDHEVVGIDHEPTAQALLAEVAVTASREPVTWGLLAWRQVVPFQCRMRAPVDSALPTTQALSAEVAVTPLRRAAGLGLGIRLHVVPFQCKMRALKPSAISALPTAHALWEEVAATAARLARIAARPRAEQHHALDPLAVHLIECHAKAFEDRIIAGPDNHTGQSTTNGAAIPASGCDQASLRSIRTNAAAMIS